MPKPFKILSDFDGVWTDQGPEAQDLLQSVARRLSDLRGVDLEAVTSDIEQFLTQMRQAPHAHGWAPTGRISAYVDEDPLVEMSALCRLLELAPAEADGPAPAYRDAVRAAGFATMEAFAQDVFAAATTAFRRDHPPGLVPRAKALLAAILDTGAEVVVVSNSGADKLAQWFRDAGVDAGEGSHHALPLRGSAAKWFVGDADEGMEVGGRKVHTCRPRYLEAIEAESPDLVIGDVFSLDLALPHVLRRDRHPKAPATLVLRRHAHTPAWVLHDRAGGIIDHVVDSVSELPAIVRDTIARTA